MPSGSMDEFINNMSKLGKVSEVWQVTKRNNAYRATAVIGNQSPIYAPNLDMLRRLLEARDLRKAPRNTDLEENNILEVWQK